MTSLTMNFGPQHPAAHGVLRLVMEIDGEVRGEVSYEFGEGGRGAQSRESRMQEEDVPPTPTMMKLHVLGPKCSIIFML